MRTMLRLAAGATLALATTGPPLAAGAQVPPPVATITPAADLTDGTAVTLTVSGLGLETVAVTQCRAGAASSADCDNSDIVLAAPSAGVAGVTIRVDAVIQPGTDDTVVPSPVDCRTAGACELRVTQTNGTVVARAPLPFDAAGPVSPPPAATIDPAGPYTDRQQVTVRAAGLVWDTTAGIRQCIADPVTVRDCDRETAPAVDAAGAAEARFTLASIISTPAHGLVDCRTAGACTLAVTQDWRLDRSQTVVLPLALAGPSSIPTLTVTPDQDLTDGQEVTVTGTGYADLLMALFQCKPGAATANACDGITPFMTSGGAFTSPFTVAAVIRTPEGDYDCRTSAQPCEILAIGSSPADSARTGRAAIRFAPDQPPPTTPDTTPPPTTPPPPTVGSQAGPGPSAGPGPAAGSGGATGSLPITGSNPAGLLGTGLVLAVVGAALVLAARRVRRYGTRRGG